ncbi:MAG: hypothetical protein JXB60_06540 [Candidatus Cloacimonetes bacterium]|nr:hypothetical protein [Candidatus Cloacimonadota bacterium]
MLSLSEKVKFIATGNLFRALLLEKQILLDVTPEFNSLVRFYNDYVYLNIEFTAPPFFGISDDTAGNKQYLGPFRNRFFLHDFLATMADLWRYPLCPDGNYPCSRYKSKTCRGFCLENRKDFFHIVEYSYLQENKELLQKLHNQRRRLFDDLQFDRAELLQKQIEVIERYYRMIFFLHIAKNLDMEYSDSEGEYSIHRGIITWISVGGKDMEFPCPAPSYRDNEYLAIDKSCLDEMWIVFEYLLPTQGDFFAKIYLNSRNRLLKLFS